MESCIGNPGSGRNRFGCIVCRNGIDNEEMLKMAELSSIISAIFYCFSKIWVHDSLPKIVLSSLAGDIAEENGMTWTMMITCKTSCAGVVVIP